MNILKSIAIIMIIHSGKNMFVNMYASVNLYI